MSSIASNRVLEMFESAKRENMTHLELHRLGLRTLPDVPADLSELRGLNLSCNRLQGLPSSVWKLSRLKRLDIGNNRFSTIDPAIACMTALRILVLCL